jgi:ubiquitin
VPNRSHKLHSEGQPQPAGFEERTLTVFFNDRLVHAQLLLPIGPTTDDLVDKRREVAAEAARTFDTRAEEQRYADEERRKAAAFAILNAKENGDVGGCE